MSNKKKKQKKIILYIVIAILLIALVYLYLKPIEPAHITTETTTEITTSSDLEAQTTAQATTQAEATTTLMFNNADEARTYVEQYASEMGYSLSAYPDKFFDLMVKDPSSIPFVIDYPARINDSRNYAKATDEEISNGVPLFLQWDTRWGYHKFKNGVVGPDGCGAACIAMTAVYLTGDASLTPDAISDYIADNGCFIGGSGLSWSFFDKDIKHYGISTKSVSNNENKMKDALDKGNPIIVSVGPGDFTRKGHFIVLTGYNDNGFIINDPYSLVNSQKQWTYERLKSQIRSMWEIYK